jgi:hypothetical protein
MIYKLLILILIIPSILFSGEKFIFQSEYFQENNKQFTKISYFSNINNLDFHKDINIFICGKLNDIQLLDKARYFLINLFNEIIHIDDDINLAFHYPKNDEMIYFKVQKSNRTDFRNLIRTINLLVPGTEFIDKSDIIESFSDESINIVISLEHQFAIDYDGNYFQFVFKEQKDSLLSFNYVEYNKPVVKILDVHSIDYKDLLLNFYESDHKSVNVLFDDSFGIKYASKNTVYGINNYFFTKDTFPVSNVATQKFVFNTLDESITYNITPAREDKKIKTDLVKIFRYNLYIYALLNNDIKLLNNILSDNINDIIVTETLSDFLLSNFKDILTNEDFLSTQEENIFKSDLAKTKIPNDFIINFSDIEKYYAFSNIFKKLNLITPPEFENYLKHFSKYLSLDNIILFFSDLEFLQQNYTIYIKIQKTYLNKLGLYLQKNFFEDNEYISFYNNYIIINSDLENNNAIKYLEFIETEISSTESNKIILPLNYFQKIYNSEYQDYIITKKKAQKIGEIIDYRKKYYDFLAINDVLNNSMMYPVFNYQSKYNEDRFLMIDFFIDDKLIIGNQENIIDNIDVIIPFHNYLKLFDELQFKNIQDGFLIIFDDNSKVIFTEHYEFTPQIVFDDMILSTEKYYIKKYDDKFFVSKTRKGLNNLSSENIDKIHNFSEYQNMIYLNKINQDFIKEKYFDYLKKVKQVCLRNIYFKNNFDYDAIADYVCPTHGEYLLVDSNEYFCSKHNTYFDGTDIYYNYSKTDFNFFYDVISNISMSLGIKESNFIFYFSLLFDEVYEIPSYQKYTLRFLYLLLGILIVFLFFILFVVKKIVSRRRSK